MPSTWFQWHAALINSGSLVLDLACGDGTEAIAAARRGAHVIAIDNDPQRIETAQRAAAKAHVEVEWIRGDLTSDPLPEGPFDVVMMFEYLDRARMPDFLARVRPGGFFLGETFLVQQRELGWGPTSDEHLLTSGEFWSLVEPLEIVLAREVLEILDGHTKAVSSILARRPLE